MFDLRRLVHIGKAVRQPVSGHNGGEWVPADPVRVLAITENPDDSAALQLIAARYSWKISIVDTSEAAIGFLKDQPAPLVICDRDLSGETWRDVLAKVTRQPQAVCVLLASHVIDEYLWHQVIRENGYDVVAKPFQPEEIRRAVTFAWSWRSWVGRHTAEALQKPTA